MSKPAKDEAELVERIASSIPAWSLLAAIRAAGWAVVPVEPTEEMFDAGHASSAHGNGIVALYRAMLAAAPEMKP